MAGGPFDVVVVGAGSAGCVVGARLAAASSRSVLLLEAGPDLRAATPAELRNGWDLSREGFDWGYTAAPDPNGTVRNVLRKRAVGGTSWLTRFTPRGSPADFDEWAANGNSGWSFEDVLPYFLKLETDTDFGHEPWHGDAGPMPSTRYLDLEVTPIEQAGVEALGAAGFPSVDDHNRPGAVGAGPMPMSSVEGRRVTTADAYLPLGATPPNLTIRADAHVAEITFDGTRASGVRLVDGTTIEAGHVVVCAGTYGTPTLLLRSGVGPASHLAEVDVPVVVDLPGVGANLVDHPAVYVECGYTGPGREAPVLHSIATFHSDGRPSDAAPDLMLWISDPLVPPGEPGEFDIDVLLLRPESRGHIQLRSADPVEPPVIELPALNEAADVERLCEGYRRAVEVANHPDLRRLCDGPPSVDLSDRELARHVRAEAYSIPHVVGTCAMGPDPDAGAVVDAGCAVHGVQALTIADASVMPDVPSGFTHFPTIMIGECIAERLARAV